MGNAEWENGCGGRKRRKTTSLKVNAVESRAYFSAKCMDFFSSETMKARLCSVTNANARLPLPHCRDAGYGMR